jgi:uncharacterized membrane-anchored protein
MTHWRVVLVWLGLLLALGVANRGILGHERTLADGRVLLLALAPVDPRSMMQGDYMALLFAAADDVRKALYPESPDSDVWMLRQMGVSWSHRCSAEGCHEGYLVLATDKDGVGRFVRIQAAPTPLGRGEVAVRFRERDWREIRIASNAWFFAEGQAKRYESATYGELRVAPDGTALLTGLRDAQRKRL